MKTLVVLVGPPGCGKSTQAKELERQGYVRISQDDQGKQGHLDAFVAAMESGSNIVIDRMNFSREQRARYIEPAKKLGYYISIETFFVPYEECLKRCLARKDHPTIKDEGNARSALRTFFTKYEKPAREEGTGSLGFKWWKDPNLTSKKPECMIVDLDGTLCNIDHRLHFVRRDGKKDWRSFFLGLEDDAPNLWCRNLVERMSGSGEGADEESNTRNTFMDHGSGYRIVFCSGRPNDYRDKTERWLRKHTQVHNYDLFMRHEGDHRRDDLVKEMLLDFEILTRYNPKFAIDDRQQVVDMWRKRDIVCLQCAKGDF